MKTLAIFASLILLTGLFNACIAQNSDMTKTQNPISVSKILTSHQCNIAGPTSAHWINNRPQLISMYKQVTSHIINAKPSIPDIDFSTTGILVVSMGTQRSGGYGLSLTKSPTVVKNDTATLKINWRKPAKGMMTIQMLTNPCLILKIQKGNFKILRIVTLTGKEIGRVIVN